MTTDAASTAARTAFADRVQETTAGPCRLLTLPTPAEEVVSWRGSFRALPDFAGGDELIQELTVSLLDKGTTNRDRFALAQVLEDRGAELNLWSDGLRIRFSGRALTEDVPDVMEVLAEMLAEPLFDRQEFEKEKAQLAASLQHQMDQTSVQAAGALARALYPSAHPNYRPPPEALLDQLVDASLETIQSYHDRHVGARDFVIAAAGDLDPERMAGVVERCFDTWDTHEAPERFSTEAAPSTPGRDQVHMPDRDNVDVRLGHGLAVRRDDQAYLPLYLANYVLGGNFSARLMTVVRDEKGLTYGTGSRLSGISTEYDGYWSIHVALSQDKIDEGIEATREEVRRFVDGGITDEELAEKKTTITGSFKVGMATTGRLARALLANDERGFAVSYLDEFPEKVEALTLTQVNAAAQEHFQPERLHEALAGTLEF